MPPTRRKKKPRAPAKRIQFTDSQRETMRNNMHEFDWYGDWEHEEHMGLMICQDLTKDFAPKFPGFTYDELYEKIKSWCSSEKYRLEKQGILYKSTDDFYLLDGWKWDEVSRALVKEGHELVDEGELRTRLGELIERMLSRGLGEMVTTVCREQFEAEPERARRRKEREEEIEKERLDWKCAHQEYILRKGTKEGQTAGEGTDGEIKDGEE